MGEILRASGVPTIEFRASIVIGSGSASFEMIRALVEKLPVMVTPRWVRVRAQPIAIEDVLAYLLEALDREPRGGELFEIGGSDRVTYLDLMQEYASQRGLRRTMIPVPVLTPRLSSLWLWLVTPVYAGVGRKLVDSLKNETVVEDDRALEVFRGPAAGIHDAIARALAFEDSDDRARRAGRTRRSPRRRRYGGVRQGSRLVDTRSVAVAAAARSGLRADPGDRRRDGLVQGRCALEAARPARRSRRRPRPPPRAARSRRSRGRRHARLLARRGVRAGSPAAAQRGDEGARARLAAVRGLGRPTADRRSTITQTAIFDPSGLFGLVYWYGLWPFHGYIFGGMLRNIVSAAHRARAEPAAFETGTDSTQTRHTARSSLRPMEEARRVIERLDRIDALDRATASPAELLAELRGLLHDAEAWVGWKEVMRGATRP